MEPLRQSDSLPILAMEVPICAERIREQLHRILSSSDFAMPERIQGFLSYVIEEALAGRADRIKGYSIAVEVFGRGPDFDKMNDPVVRIEAGRLRRALERYYLLQGRLDPLIIDMPKGGYAPSFRLREIGRDVPLEPKFAGLSAIPASRRAGGLKWPKNLWLQGCFAMLAVSALVVLSLYFERAIPDPEIVAPRPSIIVKAFENLSPGASAVVAAGLSDEILAALSSNGDLAIFRSEVAGSAVNAPIELRRVPKQYILDGAIRETRDKIRIASRLVQADTGQIVWSNIFESDLKSNLDNETDIATKISTSVTRTVLPAKNQ